MSTIAENIKTLQSIKTDIKSAIAEKGGSVGDTFTSYAQAIRDLPSGGGGIDLYSITDKTLSEIDDTKGTITDFDLYGFETLTSINLPQCWSIGYDKLIDPTKLTSLSLGAELLLYDNFIYNVSGFDLTKYSETACIINSEAYSSLFSSGCLIYNLNSSNMSSYNWTGIRENCFAFDTFTNASFPYAWYVASQAFNYCYYLTSISLPKARYIGNQAFYRCSALTSADLPKATYIGSQAFYSDRNLTYVSLPQATYIGSQAFYSCSKLKTVNMPNVTKIESNVFGVCTTLLSLSIPNVLYISNYAFQSCYALASVSLPNVEFIGTNAFMSCTTLSQIILPKARYIGSQAFYDCSALTSADLPNVLNLGYNAFMYCSNFTSVNLPLIKTITGSHFTYCSKLSYLSVPNASFISGFDNFSELTFVNIDNIKTIERWCFNSASKLQSLYMRSITSVPTWQIYALSSGASSTVKIYVPSSLVSEFQTTTGWSTFSSCYVGV